MMTKEHAQTLVEKILGYSKFPDCAVRISEIEQAQVRFANNGVTTAGFTLERTVTVASTREGKTGEAATSDIGEAGIRAAVARSEELAALSPRNAEYMEPLEPQNYPPIAAWDEDTASARSPRLIPHVRSAIERAGKREFVAAGFFSRNAEFAVTANKKGLSGYHRSTNARMSTTVRTPDGSSSGWASQPSPRIRGIDGGRLAEIAADKCAQWKNPKRLEPGKYTVLLEPTAVSDLLASLGRGALAARAAEEGRSFLSKRGGGTLIGEKLFPESITLKSDPFDPRAFGHPWTPEGTPNGRMTWIEKGVVQNLAYGRYWAAKSRRQPTPAPESLILEGGGATRDQLIRSIEKGLLVTRFWYIRPVNPRTLQLTGLTRDGLFLIENGKIAGAAVNMRFNESPVRMLQNVVKLGDPVACRGGEGGGIVAPSLVARDFTFTSVSDAV